MSFWVYMLRCADGSYYVAQSDELEKRILEHESGKIQGYTASCRPVQVVFTQECSTREDAPAAEIRIKGWSRKKKEALMHGDWAEVPRLAQRRKPFR